jgi:hypothetical protein
MKKLALIAAMGLMGMGSAMAQATSASAGFQVAVTLISQCRVNTAYQSQSVNFNYTAFGGVVNSTTTPEISFECTRNFAPTGVAFDEAGGTAAGAGVVGGLGYTLTASTATTTAGAAATSTAGAGADIVKYTISGTMLGNQSGDRTAATPVSRQLMISF